MLPSHCYVVALGEVLGVFWSSSDDEEDLRQHLPSFAPVIGAQCASGFFFSSEGSVSVRFSCSFLHFVCLVWFRFLGIVFLFILLPLSLTACYLVFYFLTQCYFSYWTKCSSPLLMPALCLLHVPFFCCYCFVHSRWWPWRSEARSSGSRTAARYKLYQLIVDSRLANAVRLTHAAFWTYLSLRFHAGFRCGLIETLAFWS